MGVGVGDGIGAVVSVAVGFVGFVAEVGGKIDSNVGLGLGFDLGLADNQRDA